MIDKLQAFRGQPLIVSDYIKINQPTLEEIVNYGESKYFQMVRTLACTPADLNWQLHDMGIDYTKITEFELFANMLVKLYSQEETEILFGDLDFSRFEFFVGETDDKMCLAQTTLDKNGNLDVIIIDEYTYMLIVNYLRTTHALVKNEIRPANESTRIALIEDAKEEYLHRLKNPGEDEGESYLLNMISAMVNSEGFKYNHDTVWDMKIYAFIDSVKRISKIKRSDVLLQSGYSGFGIDLEKLNEKELDWLGGLD